MRLDKRKVRIALALKDLRRVDIIRQHGIPAGTLSFALAENAIGRGTAEKIAAAIGCRLDEIVKAE